MLAPAAGELTPHHNGTAVEMGAQHYSWREVRCTYIEIAISLETGAEFVKYVKSCSIKGEVKDIFLPPPELRIGSAISSHLADEWFLWCRARDCWSIPFHRFTVLAATTPSDS